MTDSKHTPGPWEARNHQIWTQDAPLHIANIQRAPDGDWSPANAALIAAAPELLDALKVALSYAGIGDDWVSQARKAISKARTTR